MLVPSEVFCWLRGLGLLSTKEFKALSDRQEVEERDSKELMYGITILRLIDKICNVKKIEYLKLGADQHVAVFSKAKMILNWRAAFAALPKLGLSLEQEMLTLILNGDESMIMEVFSIIYHKFGKKVDMQEQDEIETLKVLGLSESKVQERLPSAKESVHESRLGSANTHSLVPLRNNRAKSSMTVQSQNLKVKKQEIVHDSQFIKPNLPTLNQSTLSRNFTMAGSKLNLTDFNLSISAQLVPLDVQKIEMDHPRPQDISHLFEYLLVTLGESLNLKLTNVIPIFAGGGKILANLIVKGVKYEGFDNIVHWFRTLREDTNRIYEMILMDDSWSTLKLFLSSLKPGLISKNSDVAELTLQIFTRLCILLKEKNLLNPLYQWSTSPKGLIGMLIFCIKRHIDLEPQVYTFIRALTIDSHLVEFLYKVEEFIDNMKQFNFFIHSSLVYFLTDSIMRHQIEAGKMERHWIERVVAELAQKTRHFEMGRS